jgi:hypothetical protein
MRSFIQVWGRIRTACNSRGPLAVKPCDDQIGLSMHVPLQGALTAIEGLSRPQKVLESMFGLREETQRSSKCVPHASSTIARPWVNGLGRGNSGDVVAYISRLTYSSLTQRAGCAESRLGHDE